MRRIVSSDSINGCRTIYRRSKGKIIRGALDRNGKEQFPELDHLGFFHCDLAVAELDGKSGYVDRSLQWVIPPEFDLCDDFSEEFAFVQSNGNCMLINRTGETVRVWDEQFVTGTFRNGLCAVSQMSDGGERRSVAYTDTAGDFIIPFGEEMLITSLTEIIGDNDDYCDGLIRHIVSGLYGFINCGANIIIPPVFDHAARFSGGLAAVRRNGLYGYINTKGEESISFSYECAGTFEGNYAPVKTNGSAYFIDKAGKMVTTNVYDKILSLGNGYWKAYRNGFCEILDSELKKLIPGRYFNITSFTEGIIGFETWLKEGISDRLGNKLSVYKQLLD
jgi:hypothetical protein